MKKTLLLSILLLSNLGFIAARNPMPAGTNPGNKEMGFTENKGQIADHDGNLRPDVLFQSEGTGPQIFVTTSGLTYVFHQYNSVIADKDEKNNPLNWSKIEMKLEGASIKKENIIVENPLPGVSNFYYAHCPQGILDVKTFHKITIKNIYPGIDWVLTADKENGMAHDFIVHPEGNSSAIKIAYMGIKGIPVIENSGKMLLKSEYGNISEGGLNVYEEGTGNKLKANFKIEQKTVRYSIAPYSHLKKQTIVIDPPLQWSMPQSSTNFDYGYAVCAANDASGDVLVTGASDGTDFPTLNAYQGSLFGFEDMVVERLNASGTRLWSTYYGGTDYEQGKGITSDNAGNCYVTGNTGSTDFPVLNPLQASYGGGVYDVAILKFNSSGVRQWATWYGALSNDYGTAITSDATGTIYVTGYTNSSAFPTLTPHQGTKNISYDAFILKLNSSSVLQWGTFYGGDDDDKARAITIDAAGTNIFITGTTLSGGFPITAGSFQNSSQSAYNAEELFILKMSTSQVVQWASYCGGSDADFGQGIAVDNNGNVFVTGYTLSSDYPVLDPGSGAYYNGTIASAGTHDGFITEINPGGTAKIWSTYFGGTGVDLALAITFDPTKGIFICGNTSSTDFPLHQSIDNNYYQSTQGDGGTLNDMFIAWFNTNDSLKWSTYYGDANGNEAYGICVDASHNIFVTGVDNDNLAVLKFNPEITTGISTVADVDAMFIYPNPSTKTLALQLNSSANGKFTFEFINEEGQLISKEERTISAGDRVIEKFDVNEFAKGTYYLKIYSPEGKLTVKPFVKE